MDYLATLPGQIYVPLNPWTLQPTPSHLRLTDNQKQVTNNHKRETWWIEVKLRDASYFDWEYLLWQIQHLKEIHTNLELDNKAKPLERYPDEQYRANQPITLRNTISPWKSIPIVPKSKKNLREVGIG